MMGLSPVVGVFGSRGGSMETVEIYPLTRTAVGSLLGHRNPSGSDDHKDCQRRAPRWPFPGTVELWLPQSGGGERYSLASSINLSSEGIGIRLEEALAPGQLVGIAFHEPEASFHGRAVVRHCTEIVENVFYIGMQFRFDAS